ncbi:MAG: O-antigen ligase [Halioglobus sp.]|jgi:O-antigen ligase
MTIALGTGVIPTIAVFTGGPLERILTPVWLMLYVLSFMGLMITHGVNWISWLVRYRILLVFLIMGTVMSVSWSIDAQVSAERTVHLFGSTLIAIYIGFTVPLLTTLRVFAVVLAICLVASIAAVVGLPDLGIESYEGSSVWRGVFNSKNDLGFWSGVGVLLYITLSDSTHSSGFKLMCFLMAGVSLALLGLSHSATSLLAMLVAGALSLYLFIASRFQLSFIRMAVMAILFTAVVALAIANIETAELIGRSDDLTGRGEVWRQTWKLILEKPLTGVGYGSLWYPTDATLWIQQSLTDFTWVVYHAHNGLLQVASEVGLPLAMIALLMVAQQLIEIFYCQYERQQVGVLFVLAFVTAYLISNFSEARFLVNRELFWIFFLALPISMLRQINLVSNDCVSESVNLDSRRPVAPLPYSAVPGKPWLGPMPGGVLKPAIAGVSTASVVPYLPSAAKAVKVVEPWSGGVDSADNNLSNIQDDVSDHRESIDHDELLYDDTLDIDRYDMDFELADNAWVDIPLMKDDK